MSEVKKRRVFWILGMMIGLPIQLSPGLVSAATTDLQCVALFQNQPAAVHVTAPGAQGNHFGEASHGEIPGVSHDQLKTNLKSVLITTENNYGPRLLKEKTIGLHWDLFKQKIMSSMSRIHSFTDFHLLLADAFNSLNDAHVSVTLPSSLVWSLPMQFSAVGDKIILTYIVPSQMNLPDGPGRLPKIGDELLTVNGQSLGDYQNTNPYFHKYGNDISNRSFFARLISKLREARGYPLSRMTSPDVTLVFKSGTETFAVKTRYKSEGVGFFDRGVTPPALATAHNDTSKPSGAAAAARLKEAVKVAAARARFARGFKKADAAAMEAYSRQFAQFNLLMNARMDSALGADIASADDTPPADAEGTKFEIGARLPLFKMPADFEEFKLHDEVASLLNGKSFYAGFFTRNGKKIGFLRIPEYTVETKETMLASLRLYIAILEAQTDELILDQSSNPGGNLSFADLLVKSLAGEYRDASHMRFLLKPNPNFTRRFAEIIDSIESDPSFLPPAEAKEFVRRLRAEWSAMNQAYQSGADLSEPISLRLLSDYFEMTQEQMIKKSKVLARVSDAVGIDLTQPQKYTKKVYVLIDQFDASCADAVPAMLQDYGRATLVGVRTVGAGGTVEDFSDRLISDIQYSLTTSLMYRKGGRFVENYGVQPDVPFELTTEDYVTGFAGTLDRLLQTIESSGH